ncbi:MAG TPA: arginine--tRNA ligase, partial [Chloroflexota bacterium]|nr:arginine--tRNA ligase [Chloroflexota bacterium]
MVTHPSPYALLEAECRALLLPHVPEGTVLRFERAPNPELGDLACPVALQLSRELKRAPLAIAEQIVAALDLSQAMLVREVRAAKPGFINFYTHADRFTRLVLDTVHADGAAYGRPPAVQARHVVVEHTSVNPNKPWHIGHVRNAVLGDVLGRLFRFAGHEVEIQNYIDDTGKQVADMLFGLQYLGLLGPHGEVSMPAGQKADHFVGDAYVRINALVKEGVVDPAVMEAGSAAFMHAREEGQFRDLVHMIVYAQLATAWRLGIFYNLLTWEGDIVQAHLFEEAMA